MARLRANGLDFEVESHGLASAPAVMLIMGLGMQLTAWPASLVDQLVQGGYRVITFDNRDIGLSSKMESAGSPNVIMAFMRSAIGLSIDSPYSLVDMADDAAGILSALGIEKAHIVGVSMGGMIAQLLAANHPGRVLSLTSIMSTSGAPGLPSAEWGVTRTLISRPKNARDISSLVEHYVHLYSIIGSPGYPIPHEVMYERLRVSLTRSYYPLGIGRQMLAIMAGGDRSEALGRISAPTLVIHGVADPLVPIEGGRDTAKKIRGAELIEVEGMGHDLPPGLMELIGNALTAHFRRARSL